MKERVRYFKCVRDRATFAVAFGAEFTSFYQANQTYTKCAHNMITAKSERKWSYSLKFIFHAKIE